MHNKPTDLHRYFTTVWILSLVVIFVVLPAAPAFAQDSSNQNAQNPAVNITRNEINEVASELYCPLCSGVRLDSCELQACDQMREEIALQLASGADKAAIKDYFLNQYGPQVLGEPPRDSLLNWLAWVLPFAALGIAGLWLLMRSRRTVQVQPIAAASATAMVSPTISANGQTRPSRTTDDEYMQKLDEELRQYE